ncbi:MAG: hypothetical protein WA213_16355 [Terriglobales bacterium]
MVTVQAKIVKVDHARGEYRFHCPFIRNVFGVVAAAVEGEVDCKDYISHSIVRMADIVAALVRPLLGPKTEGSSVSIRAQNRETFRLSGFLPVCSTVPPASKLTDNGLIGQLVANDAKISRNTFGPIVFPILVAFNRQQV